MTQSFYNHAPVVALHSSASGPAQWRRLALDLAERHAVTVPKLTHDCAGQGLAVAADAVIAQLLRIGEPVHLVGHSFGGAVALKIAVLRPDLIASLTLYEPSALFLADCTDEDEALGIESLRQIAASLAANIEAGRADVGIRQFIAFWHNQDCWDHLPASKQLRLAAAAPSVVDDFTAVFSERMSLTELHSVQIPTLVMLGMDSPQLTQRIAARIANAMPRARLAILPSLGHMAPLTDPEWVNPRICQHIAEASRNSLRVCWPKAAAA